MPTEFKINSNLKDASKTGQTNNETVESTVSSVFERAQSSNHEQDQDNTRVFEKLSLEKRVCNSQAVRIQPPLPPPRPDRVVDLTHNLLTEDRINYPATNEKQDSSSTVVESLGYVQMELIAEENQHSPPQSRANAENSKPVETPVVASTADTRTGRKSIGKWQLGKTIGEGSSGKVKLATHQDTKETVIYKLITSVS
jgi:hypothetical protein